MRKITITLVLMLLGVLACGTQEEKVLVTVGDEEIKVKDFLARYRPKAYPTEEAELEAKREALDKLIEDKLLVAEMKQRGYEQDSVLEQGIKDAREQALINALFTELVIEKSEASRWDARRFYDADKVLLDLKLIHTDTDTAAYLVLQEFSAGVPFDTLAARYSSHPSASQGGDIGTLPLSQFYETEAYKPLSKLKEGETTMPIESEMEGFDIFYLEKRSEKEDVPPFSEVEESMKQRIERQRQAKLSQESLEMLLDEARIEYNNDALALLSKPQDQLSETELSQWAIKIRGEVVDSVGSMLDVYRQFPQGVPPQLVQRVAERRAMRPALLRAASKRNLEREPMVEEAVQNYLDSQLRNRIYRQEVSQKIEVTPEEVKAYYQQHPDEFFVPERRKLSIIRTSSYSDIQQAYSELRQGTPFSEVARKYSDHSSSARRGGSIGFRRADDVSFKQFVQQGFEIPQGSFSRPFEVYNGFGIVKVEDVQPAYAREFASEERRIQRKLRNQKEEAREQEFLDQLREKFQINIDEDLLASIGKVEKEPREQESETR